MGLSSQVACHQRRYEIPTFLWASMAAFLQQPPSANRYTVEYKWGLSRVAPRQAASVLLTSLLMHTPDVGEHSGRRWHIEAQTPQNEADYCTVVIVYFDSVVLSFKWRHIERYYNRSIRENLIILKHRGAVYSMQMIHVNGKNECMLHESECQLVFFSLLFCVLYLFSLMLWCATLLWFLKCPHCGTNKGISYVIS